MKQYKVRFFSNLQDHLPQEFDATNRDTAWGIATKWASDYNKTVPSEARQIAIHSITRIK